MSVTAPTTEAPQARYQRARLYPRQEAALFAPERWVFVEASTKSGKTVGCIAWLLEQAALQGRRGRNYWWVAPTLPVAKIAYRRVKEGLARHWYATNDTDSRLQLLNGATIWFKGADRPDTLYGEDVYGAVMDEGSRCKEDAWIALHSTLTATQGPVRVIGNVKGKKNWFYRLCRRAEAKQLANAAFFRLTADHAIEAGIFPSEEIKEAREHMPESAWRELFYAEADDDGSNPFGYRAIEACIKPLSTEPIEAFGWDFARAQDFTVGVGVDRHYQTVRWDRFQLPSWGETYKRVQYNTGTTYCWGDSTGVGDAVVEEIGRLGVPINGYHFSQASKQKLMERLASAIQQGKVGFPDGPIRHELESFEYTYTRKGVRYSAPAGFHDDCVVALALAVYARDQLGYIPEPLGEQGPLQDRGADVRVRKRLESMGLLEGGSQKKRMVPIDR